MKKPRTLVTDILHHSQEIPYVNYLKNQKICVMGLGVTGLSVIKFFSEELKISLNVVNSGDPKSWYQSNQLSTLFPRISIDQCFSDDEKISPEALFHLKGMNLLVVSPGIPPAHPFIQKLLSANPTLQITGEIELAYRIFHDYYQLPHTKHLRPKILGITGTNGKTTTTTLAGHVLKSLGKKVFVGGNIGIPFLEYFQSFDHQDCVVLELSSFQLAQIDHFRADVSLILNLYPNHGERYLGLKDYAEDKLQILKHSPKCFAHHTLEELFTEDDIKKQFPHCDLLLMSDESLKTKLKTFEVEQDRMLIQGEHNLENIVFCLEAIMALKFCDLSSNANHFHQLKEAVYAFPGVAHRIQWVPGVRSLWGFDAFDDAKSTNWDATITAVKAMKPSHELKLILGGKKRGVGDDIAPHLEFFSSVKHLKEILFVGEMGRIIFQELENEQSHKRNLSFSYRYFENYKQLIHQLHQENFQGALLLSPAFPSFDQFKNYEERGETFQALLRDTPKQNNKEELMKVKKFLNTNDIQHHIHSLKQYLKKHQCDALYVSSSDIFLNEYIPLQECHSYYVTGFTGSTSEVVLLKNEKVQLFVDGRYFEQADLECDPSLVQVHKVPYGVGLRDEMFRVLKDKKCQSIMLESDRIDLNIYQKFQGLLKVFPLHNGELEGVVKFHKFESQSKIQELGVELTGMTTAEKLQKILKPGEGFFLSSLDSIAWLTNLRRYEMPFQSTFKSKALATYDGVYVLLEDARLESGDVLKGNPNVFFFEGSFHRLEEFFQTVKFYEQDLRPLLGEKSRKLEKVFYSDKSLNASDFLKLQKFSQLEKFSLENAPMGIVPFHALKNPTEIQSMKNSFNQGDKAIFQTILWAKEQIKLGKTFSELDYYNQCNEFYKKENAQAQSFNTIAAFGKNSSIIHFSSPSSDVLFTKNQLALLDSGGYFASGFATDTTRTFLSGGEANAKQKEIYTLVLKAILHGMNAVFPKGTWGAVVDGVIRQPLFQAGQNFQHGTGHGVGINVHEGGFRLSTASNIPLVEGLVGSIEPGIYIPGFGGVRLENVAVVVPHPDFEGMLRFESLVYVGFDHDLIEFEMLTEQEEKWLNAYEDECHKRQRSFVLKDR